MDIFFSAFIVKLSDGKTVRYSARRYRDTVEVKGPDDQLVKVLRGKPTFKQVHVAIASLHQLSPELVIPVPS